MTNTSALPEQILSDMRWLGTLAERIISDPSLAQDACQEAWLAATRSGNDEPTRPRLWWGLRRYLWLHRRSEQRRRRYEAEAAEPQSVMSPEELLLRGEQRVALWSALRKLAEPYRSTLLLRFQEDLDPTTIAARTGIPVDTVRWRVRRGLELLRGWMADEGSNGAFAGCLPIAASAPSWVNAGAASTCGTAGTGESILGGLWIMKKLALGVAAVLALVIWIGSETWDPSTIHGSPPVGPATPTATVAFSESSKATEMRPSQRVLVERTAPPTAEDVAIVTGRALDTRGKPVANATLTIESARRWKRSTASTDTGRFELRCPVQVVDELRLICRGPSTLVVESIPLGRTNECEFGALVAGTFDVGNVILKDAGSLTGFVHDASGAGVEGLIHCDGSTPIPIEQETGAFRADRVRTGEVRLFVSCPGFLQETVKVRVRAGVVLDVPPIVLTASPRVQGRVVDERGSGIPGARVRTGWYSRNWRFDADEGGAFDAPLSTRDRPRVQASAPGYLDSKKIGIRPGDANVVIQLTPAGSRCEFQIIDAETEEPVPSFWLYRRGATQSAVPYDFSSAEGRGYLWGRPHVDSYFVKAAGYRSQSGKITDEGRARDGAQVVRLRPLSSTRISGRVLHMGRPAVGIRMRMKCGKYARLVPVPKQPNGITPLRPEMKALKQGGYAMPEVLADDRNPVPDVALDRIASTYHAMTNRDGYFEFLRIPRGVAQLTGVGYGLKRVAVRQFAHLGTDDVDLGDIQIVDAGTIQGRVVLTTRGPLAGHSIYVVGERTRRARTDSAGRFSMAGFSPGLHFLSVDPAKSMHVEGIPPWIMAFVPAGGSAQVEVPLRPLQTCSLDVVATINGQPAAGWELDLSAKGDELVSADLQLDAKGSSRGRVPADVEFRVSLAKDGIRIRWPTTFKLPAEPRQLRLAFRTGELELEVPRSWITGKRPSARLKLKREGGEDAYVQAEDLRLIAGQERHSIRFLHVPMDATGMHLELRHEGDYSWKHILTRREKVEVQMIEGGAVKIVFR